MSEGKASTTWPVLPVGEVLKRVRRPVNVEADASYREIGVRSHCKGVFHKSPTTGEQIGDKRVFWVEPGCLVLNIVFAWEHAVALTTDDEAEMIASHRFPMYESRNGQLLAEYAWRYFSSPRGKYDLGVASPGGAGRNKTLGQHEFDRLKIPVPPIAYQRDAVATLRAVDRAIRVAEDLAAAKQSLKRGLTAELLSGSRRVAGFSEDWGRVRLGEIATIIVSGVDKKTRPGEQAVRLCNYTDVYRRDRLLASDDFMHASASPTEIKRLAVAKGDVIITKDSETPDDIAKPAVVAEDMPGVICGYHLAILRAKHVDSEFLAQMLRLPSVRRAFYRVANGVTRFGLTHDAMSSLELRLPCTEEQRKMAAILRAADGQADLLNQKIGVLRQLKSGLARRLLAYRVSRGTHS